MGNKVALEPQPVRAASPPSPSPSSSPSPSPSRRFYSPLVAVLGFASLASYHLTGSWVPTSTWDHHHHHDGHHGNHCQDGVDSPYGRFPRPDDPFKFLPCTNTTTPPALDDTNHQQSWAGLFDPDPRHWSWGNKYNTTDDPYAARGIYLCGYLDVPLDYLNKSETRITRLAVTKYQVSGLARLDGSSPPGAGSKSERTLVLEPGGPGGSGISMAWSSSEQLTQRFTDGAFDTLGWDPRGVNASQPAIACYPYDADRDRWSMLTGLHRQESADPDTLLRWADAMNNATFHACFEKYGDLGRFMTTTLVARDLEEIRKALREPQLTGYLVSYGTGIGQTYVNMFPDSAGRVVLDGTEYVRDHRLLGGFVSLLDPLVHERMLTIESPGLDSSGQCHKRLARWLPWGMLECRPGTLCTCRTAWWAASRPKGSRDTYENPDRILNHASHFRVFSVERTLPCHLPGSRGCHLRLSIQCRELARAGNDALRA